MNISELLNSGVNSVKAWYPSSGLDFRDLLVLGQNKFIFDKNAFANEMFEFVFLPDLFIHTDIAYSSDNWPLADKGIIHEDGETTYTIIKTEDVFSDDRVIGKYLNLSLKSTLLGKDTNQNMLFLFSDNLDFFKNHILNNNLKIDFFINIRDGASENGGADYSLKMLEFYLGFMNTKYLISDNFGRSPSDFSKFKDDDLMMEALNSEKNKPVVLQGLKEWSWSEFGVFRGDAFLMMVHKFFDPINNS
jgi:hypothetical protein